MTSEHHIISWQCHGVVTTVLLECHKCKFNVMRDSGN